MMFNHVDEFFVVPEGKRYSTGVPILPYGQVQTKAMEKDRVFDFILDKLSGAKDSLIQYESGEFLLLTRSDFPHQIRIHLEESPYGDYWCLFIKRINKV